MTALPRNWRTQTTARLREWTMQNGDHPDYDDVWAEIDDREHQTAANSGAMNGLAPEVDLP